MEIIECIPESVDRMYCPSTDETIFAPGYEQIAEDASAFIAYWHGDVIQEPFIKDVVLKEAWGVFIKEWNKSKEKNITIWEAVEKFLKEYNNPDWKVYECTFYGMACGPVSATIYFVVDKNTIIEEDPDWEEIDIV